MPEGSGVIFALATVGKGPTLKAKPPANTRSMLACPRCCGVWQLTQLAIRVRYSQRFTGLDTSGGGTGPLKGCGAPRIKYFTGKMISVFGRGLRTGGSERR